MKDNNAIYYEAPSKEALKQFQHVLQKTDKKKMLKLLPELHEKAFELIDCLDCARCCKNYSPRFKTPDIKRISKVLGLKESVFIDQYLSLDQEGDYVTKSHPCPFLDLDKNTCSIYEDRPSDCARFPYIDEDVFFKRVQLTVKNASFCPAVHVAMKALEKR